MKRELTIRKGLSVLLALALAGTIESPLGQPTPSEARAAEPPQPVRKDSSRQGVLSLMDQHLQRRGIRYPVEIGRNHTKVKEAFLGVVAKANESTVQILCDDQLAALGTVVGRNGYILTKASELTGKIACRLRDGRKLEAQLVSSHSATDLALLKVEATGLKEIQWASPEVPAIGSFLATASPRDDVLSIGVVSVAPRKIPAASGVLGIAVGQADTGPCVDQVLEGSSAEKAGLQTNDIITQINQRNVNTRDELIDTIGEYLPGDRIELHVVRGEQPLKIAAMLGTRSGDGRREFQNRLGGELSERRGGFEQALQHDTILQPRECGGPIVDLDGRVVGINIARAERVASLALPSEVVLRVLPKLKADAIAQQGKSRAPVAGENLKNKATPVSALPAHRQSPTSKQ
ncbi:MAG: PDZ domain-containing protein [Planctomycetota bacterium]|nr:PDZ domain-containing protein [Planctomycetota bacterium]